MKSLFAFSVIDIFYALIVKLFFFFGLFRLKSLHKLQGRPQFTPFGLFDILIFYD